MSAALSLSHLNPPQREAVLHDGTPLLVLAGAGSGKTRVIIHRIARLLAQGAPAEHILGVTFTNKAAREMRERLRALSGGKASGVRLSTFHSLAAVIVREEHQAAGLQANFCIYDTSDQLSLVRELMRHIKVADRRLDAARVLDLILRTKRERRPEVEIDWGDDYELAAYDLYPRYLAQMRAFNAVDFDDLILRAEDVLAQEEPRARWSQRFKHILVDEYQDTSPDQLKLLRILAGTEAQVCAVGDDDQSIYSWRGAAADNILGFGRHFPGTREIVLAQNYRSTGNILAVANAIIRNNQARKPKELWCAAGEGDPVEIWACRDGEDEAAFVAETIGRLLFDGARHEEIAVLYRANIQSRAFEEALALERIPFRVVGGQAFFDRKEVRDAIAYLSVAHNPHDEVALRRIVNVPPRGIGATSLLRLVDHAAEKRIGLWQALCHAREVPELPKAAVVGAQDLVATLAPAAEKLRAARPGEAAALVRELLANLRLRDAILAADDAPSLTARRLENLEEVASAMAAFERQLEPGAAALGEFLRGAALASAPEEDEGEAGRGKVTLMTLHSAKGLEFPYVFLVGMEEDLLPHKRTLEESEGSLAEERRLCYVGVTRAQKGLWLCWARRRLKHGKMEERSPSRFLQEIPQSPAVRRHERDTPPTAAQSDAAAEAFFAQMRQKLGIERGS